MRQCIEGKTWKSKQSVKKGQNCHIRQKFLLAVGGGKMLVGCGQISLTSNSNVNGLNEAIPSQVWYTLLCGACCSTQTAHKPV